MNYSAGIYQGYGNERDRWAVFCAITHSWIFPSRYGKKAAEALAKRLNREI